MRLLSRLLAVFALSALLSTGSLAAESSASADVPIIMYHSLSEKAGDIWTLPPAEFERDLAYLQENGYHAVFISDLIAFVEDGTPLPEKPIALTFDDCYYNNYQYGMPLLEQYDMSMTLSVIGSYSEEFSLVEDTNPIYAHLSWDTLREMQESGRVELANHSWGLHTHENGRNGCCRKTGEDSTQYQKLLTEDVERLQQKLEENCGTRPLCFTYPFGSKCTEALDALLGMGFKASLSCYEGQNHIEQGNAESLHDLRRVNRAPGKSVEAILRELG